MTPPSSPLWISHRSGLKAWDHKPASSTKSRLTVKSCALTKTTGLESLDFTIYQTVFDFMLGTQRFYINADPLLRTYWAHAMSAQVSFIISGRELQCDHRGIFLRSKSKVNSNDYTMSNKALNLLLSDQLQLRRYGPLLCAIGLGKTGQIGGICWGSTHQYPNNPIARIPSRKIQTYSGDGRLIQPKAEFWTEFDLDTSGSQLCLLSKSVPTLLRLPELVLHRIFHPLVFSQDTIYLDTDSSMIFDCPLLFTCRWMVHDWLSVHVLRNAFNVHFSTFETRSSFSNFNKLRSLLRRPFRLPLMPDSLLEDAKVAPLNATLHFKFEGSASIDDLRINLLPLIIETSSTKNNGQVHIVIETFANDPAKLTRTEHSITRQKPRTNIIEALSDTMDAWYGEIVVLRIWIDGLGEVREQDIHSLPVLMNHGSKSYGFADGLEKTQRYQQAHCKCCHPEVFMVNFPFEASTIATLQYLS